MSPHRFIKALLRQPVDRTPIWIMRQAGRYLPEYRELRAQAGDFLSLCKNPELACEVTLQPLRRFDLDAAIIFSDILTIPDAMGLGLYFETGEGPKFKNPVRDMASIKKLGVPDPEIELRYVGDAIRETKKQLAGKTPLIGFSGSPWTIGSYMVEGGSTKSFSKIKGLCYQAPKAAHLLLDTLAQSVIQYLNAQIQAGADAVMIFDTWGGVLSGPDYREFSLRYMQQIVDGLHRERDGQTIPVTLFTKNAGQRLSWMAETGCDALGVDWTLSMTEAKKLVDGRVALQGNLDPSVLYAAPEVIRTHVKRVLTEFGPGNGHVFNLGHGIHPDISPDHVKVLVDSAHNFSERSVQACE
ncbi:MAG: uroporphyrinogen decarboxylase [marine bacterium B5-7]|nr:MAG: uroporphyrinogen decarboxylase [marine bacterium B5-7]